MNESTHRNPWLAGLMSFFVAGLGQLYNGQPLKGFVYACLNLFGQSFSFYLMKDLPIAPLNVLAPIVFILAIRLYFSVDAVLQAQCISGQYILRRFNKGIIYIAATLAYMIAAVEYAHHEPLVHSFTMPSGSMEDTILTGDVLMVNKVAYGLRVPFLPAKVLRSDVQRGDVIVFDVPDAGRSSEERIRKVRKLFIKRVVALPGEEVQIINKHLWINGQPQTEPGVRHKDVLVLPNKRQNTDWTSLQHEWESGKLMPETALRDNFGPVRIPPQSFFVLGDNRDGAFDSRFWGPVPEAFVKGKVCYVAWSTDRTTLKLRWTRFGRIIK